MAKTPLTTHTKSVKRTKAQKQAVSEARQRTKQAISVKPGATAEGSSQASNASRSIRTRLLTVGSRRSRRPHQPIKRPAVVPPAWKIARQAADMLWQNKKLFSGITAVYIVLSIVLVKGSTIGSDTQSIQQSLAGDAGISSGVLAYVLLLSGSSTGASQVSGVYQVLLTLIVSLACIWAFRHVMAGNTKLRIRDSFYQGMYPLIPGLLVLLAVGLQLLPMVLGAGLYSLLVSTGIAAVFAERLLWGLICAVIASSSFYLTISSVFALYIAALPDMTPMKALRSARDLVRYRRWTVLRKLLFLPLALLIISLVIMLPIILIITPVAPWIFFLLTMIGLPVVHAYMYTLYRELLK